MELQPGCTVAIHGLTGAAELNGKEATCNHFDKEKDRWTVQLPGGDLKALKAENLEVKAAPPEAKTPEKPEKPEKPGKPGKPDVKSWLVGAVGLVVLAVCLQQSGIIEEAGIASPAGYVKELFEPFDPPPPKAPKDTVVISFCQG